MIGAGNDKQVRFVSFPSIIPNKDLHLVCVTVSVPLLQFRSLAKHILARPELADEPRFSTNAARVANRAEIVQIVTDVLMQHEREHWLKAFEGIGCVSPLSMRKPSVLDAMDRTQRTIRTH